MLSIAAGIRIDDLSRWLGGYRAHRARDAQHAGAGRRGHQRRLRAERVDAAGRALAGRVLEAAGEVVWVDREDDARRGHRRVAAAARRTCSTSSKALEQAARELGFSAADARKLAYATFAGAIALAQAPTTTPATLRAHVTSKGGTTERALAMLEADGVKAKFVAAVKAAAAARASSATSSGE